VYCPWSRSGAWRFQGGPGPAYYYFGVRSCLSLFREKIQWLDDSLRGNGKEGSKPVLFAGGQDLQPTVGGRLRVCILVSNIEGETYLEGFWEYDAEVVIMV